MCSSVVEITSWRWSGHSESDGSCRCCVQDGLGWWVPSVVGCTGLVRGAAIMWVFLIDPGFSGGSVCEADAFDE